MAKIDMVGKRFGRLVVVSEATKDKARAVKWNCVCDCGNTVTVAGPDLRRGKSRSCGCYMRDKNRENRTKMNLTHGMTGTRIFKIWCGMKKRCYDPKQPAYKNYGGRGIKLCDEWLDFSKFYSWAMANGYTDELTIDRIDVNGNYEPSNCRWATHKEQNNNTRRSRLLTYDGETLTLSQWSEKTGINHATLWDRLNSGWTVGEALEKVYRKPYHNIKRKGA